MKRRSFLAGGASLVLLSLASRPARADALDDVLAKIAAARAPVRTLVGPFDQTRKIGLLATEVKSTGTMTLVRPDRLRWELGPPDDVVYWITPEGLAYKSRNGQGRVRGATARVAAVLDDLRTILGGDLGALRARYDLVLVSSDDSGVAFEATPRAGTGIRVQKIAFALAADLVRPSRATIIETARDRSDIVFGDLARDADVDPEKMKPPA
jgi:outer membrane lipoprotein-sorting protein